MRILYVQDSLGTGGAERSNAELWYFLRRKNVDLKIVVLEHRTVGIEDEIIKAGFDVTFLTSGNILNQVIELKTIIKNYCPDLVHSVLFRSAMRVRLAKSLLPFFHIESLVNCSYSPIRYKDPQINSLGLRIYQFLNQRTQAWGTDKFVAITEEVKRHAVDYVHIPSGKLAVINRGRTENPFVSGGDGKEVKSKYREELNFSPDEILFVHVGRQEYQKGHIPLLKAIKQNDREFESLNVHFLFCGREGNETKQIKKFLEYNRLSTKVSWLGHRSDILKILAAGDAFIFPSLFEGLGGALIEAQAAGLPILCSNIKVFQEVVNKDENALVFEVDNIEQLSNKMVILAESSSIRQEMGRKSLLNFQKKFRIEKIHQEMLNFYIEMKERISKGRESKIS